MKQKLEKIKKFVIKNWKWFMLLICIIIFIKFTEDVFNKEIMTADVVGYGLVSKYLISDFVTPIAKFITNFGGAICIIPLAGILFVLSFVVKKRKIGLAIVGNLVIVSGLNFMLKNILQRPRPTEYRIIDERGYSFPSGHSMISMAFYGFLIYLIYQYVENRYIKWTLIILLSMLIVMIGISRIYLGVHYTSDVLGGFLVAISYLVVYTSIVNRFLKESEG